MDAMTPIPVATARREIVLLSAMLILSVALNAALGYKMHALTRARADSIARMKVGELKIGTHVPQIVARRVSHGVGGTAETISFGDDARPTVLYIMSPACSWCALNHAVVQRLVAQKQGEYRFIALSLVDDGLEEYARDHAIEDLPLYGSVNEETRRAYKLQATPQTIVVSSTGVVVASWTGAYLAGLRADVASFFHAELPATALENRR